MIRAVPRSLTLKHTPVGDVVSAAEAAYVAALRDPSAPPGYAWNGALVTIADPPTLLDAGAVDGLAIAAAFATAARFLAVGTPRSIGFVGGGELAPVVLAAHRVWFAPRELRCAGFAGETIGGRDVTIEEACACDIVCVLEPAVRVEASWIRRGTHVALTEVDSLDREVVSSAKLVGDEPLDGAWGTLSEVAAGVKDGRELDEITVYVAAAPARVRAGIARVAANAAHQLELGHALDLRV
jgi:hypothetical protein